MSLYYLILYNFPINKMDPVLSSSMIKTKGLSAIKEIGSLTAAEVNFSSAEVTAAASRVFDS
jgi:hypothetical protein